MHRRVPQRLPRRSAINFDDTHVIAKTLVGSRIGALDISRTQEVKRAVGYVLDWPELKVV